MPKDWSSSHLSLVKTSRSESSRQSSTSASTRRGPRLLWLDVPRSSTDGMKMTSAPLTLTGPRQGRGLELPVHGEEAERIETKDLKIDKVPPKRSSTRASLVRQRSTSTLCSTSSRRPRRRLPLRRPRQAEEVAQVESDLEALQELQAGRGGSSWTVARWEGDSVYRSSKRGALMKEVRNPGWRSSRLKTTSSSRAAKTVSL